MIASNSNYPPGVTDKDFYDPDYREEIKVDVFISYTLSKETEISTTDYEPEEWEDYDFDGVEWAHHGGVDYKFDDTNFQKEYNNQHLTPLELIQKFKDFLTENMPDEKNAKKYKEYKYLIEECSDWSEDEIEVMKN